VKKLVVGIAATALMGTGFVSATQLNASAAPYPHEVATSTSAHAKPKSVEKGDDVTITVDVSAKQGNAVPQAGKITLTVDPKGRGNTIERTRSWNGEPVKFEIETAGKKKKKGEWDFSATYVPNRSSAYKRSSDSGSFTVR
jgi:hypothetical protein